MAGNSAIRTCQANTSISQHWEHLVNTCSYPEVGLLVGRYAVGARHQLLSIIKTPSLDGVSSLSCVTVSDAGTKGARLGSSKKPSYGPGSLTVDAEWVAEHARQVARMLPGGVAVMGIYLFCPDGAFACQTSQSLVQSLLKDVVVAATALLPSKALSLEDSGGADVVPLMLHADSESHRQSLKALQPRGGGGGGHSDWVGCEWRVIELRYGGVTAADFVLVRCFADVDASRVLRSRLASGKDEGVADAPKDGTGSGRKAGYGRNMYEAAKELIESAAVSIRCGEVVWPGGRLISSGPSTVAEMLALATGLGSSLAMESKPRGTGKLAKKGKGKSAATRSAAAATERIASPGDGHEDGEGEQAGRQDEGGREREEGEAAPGAHVVRTQGLPALYDLWFLQPPPCSAPADTSRDDDSGTAPGVHFLAVGRGVAAGVALTRPQDLAARAVADLKADLIRGLVVRLEVALEEAARLRDECGTGGSDADADADAEGAAVLLLLQDLSDAVPGAAGKGGVDLVPLPHRQMLAWEGFPFWDYVAPGEDPAAAEERAREIVGGAPAAGEGEADGESERGANGVASSTRTARAGTGGDGRAVAVPVETVGGELPAVLDPIGREEAPLISPVTVPRRAAEARLPEGRSEVDASTAQGTSESVKAASRPQGSSNGNGQGSDLKGAEPSTLKGHRVPLSAAATPTKGGRAPVLLLIALVAAILAAAAKFLMGRALVPASSTL